MEENSLTAISFDQCRLGHYAGHGSPDPGLGPNAVHASVTCGHQRVLDS